MPPTDDEPPNSVGGRRFSVAVVAALWIVVALSHVFPQYADGGNVSRETAVNINNSVSMAQSANDTDSDLGNISSAAASNETAPQIWFKLPDICRDFDIPGFMERAHSQGLRYVAAEPMRLGYGFTNQFMAYAGLASWALADDRIVIWPSAKTHFTTFVSFNRSRFHPRFRVADPCESLAAMRLTTLWFKHARFDRVRRALSRGFIAQHPVAALRKLQSVMRATVGIPLFRIWDMYERWPFACFQPVTLVWFFCSLHFNEAVEKQAETAYLELARSALTHAQPRLGDRYGGTAVKAEYLAIHLRMEPQDMISMGRSYSSPHQVAEFMRDAVFPLAKEHGITTIMLCSGKLHPDVEAAIRNTSWSEGMHVVRKTDFNVTIPHERTHVYENRGFENRPTNTFGAIFDLLLMERAKIAVVTAFSSFSTSVYSRRCCRNFTAINAAAYNESDSPFSSFGGGPQEGNVYVYDIYADGTPTHLTAFPCGFSFAEVLRGATIPLPPEELRFTAAFNRRSPLYSNHSRNDGDFQYPPGSVAFRARRP